jgi:hypothetical protein
MTLKEALKELKALGNENVRALNTKSGAGDVDAQFLAALLTSW